MPSQDARTFVNETRALRLLTTLTRIIRRRRRSTKINNDPFKFSKRKGYQAHTHTHTYTPAIYTRSVFLRRSVRGKENSLARGAPRSRTSIPGWPCLYFSSHVNFLSIPCARARPPARHTSHFFPLPPSSRGYPAASCARDENGRRFTYGGAQGTTRWRMRFEIQRRAGSRRSSLSRVRTACPRCRSCEGTKAIAVPARDVLSFRLDSARLSVAGARMLPAFSFETLSDTSPIKL